MKRKNLTRNALFTSIISLLLCVSMLVGTTFAWFTDEVASGVNQIAAGNLDVALYHGKNANPSEKVDNTDKLFTDPQGNEVVRWEPGVVAYTNLQVANEGTLALKYQMELNFGNATAVEHEGQTYTLADVLKVAVVENGFTGDRAKAQTLDYNYTLSSFALKDQLDPNTKTKTYGVVIYWEPGTNEYDNIFNLNNGRTNTDGGKELSINLGIRLFATQLDYEYDSFGDDYDEGLILPELGEDDILIEKDGIQYYYDEDGEYVLYLVTDAYTSDTVNIPEGVDRIGNYAFAYNSNVKTVNVPSTVRDLGRGFDSSSVEKVVIAEGLETISSRAFRSTTALQEVVIPASVKVIADNAFQKSGIKNIVIPATVETIGEAAFGASKIETVTFMGNTSIQGYAFRGCPNLRTVTMYGDDVTFIPSTLNGRNSMWFCNGESNNPNTSNITFYVVNETVASRVKTAMGAEANNTPVYIMGEGGATTNYVTVKSATELQNALDSATGTTVISFAADITGDAKVTQKADVKITIDGNEHKFNGVMTVFGNGRKATAALNIKNIDFVAANGAASCIVSPDRTVNNAYSYSSNVTVENCTFTDPDGAVNCAAVRHEDGGDSNWKIVDCVVDNTMHSLIQVNNVELDGLTIEGCEVYSKNGINLNQCAKVSIIDCEIDVKGYAVRYGVSGATVNGSFEIKDSTLKSANDDGDAVIIFRGTMTGSTLSLNNTTLIGNPEISGNARVLVGGKYYVTSAADLSTAVTNGETNIMLSAGTYTIPSAAKGKTLTISGTKDTKIDVRSGLTYVNGSNITFEGVTIQSDPEGAGYTNGLADGQYAIFNDCVIEGTLGLDYSCEFNNCVFNISGDYYNLWTWGAGTATFNGCTFNSDGKALLVYANVLDNGTNCQTVKLTDCTFNDNGGLSDLKAAIEIGDDYGKSYELVINNTVVNGYEINDKGINTGSTLWANKNSLSTDKLNVVVDGVDVY